MNIVVDTNVLISGVFFGGFHGKVLSSIVNDRVTAFATTEIISEYEEVVQEMISRHQGKINRSILLPLINAMEIIEPVSEVNACRDPEDNKFIGCASNQLTTNCRRLKIIIKRNFIYRLLAIYWIFANSPSSPFACMT